MSNNENYEKPQVTLENTGIIQPKAVPPSPFVQGLKFQETAAQTMAELAGIMQRERERNG